MSDNTLLAYILGSVAVMLVLALLVVFFLNFSQKKIINTKLKMLDLELNFQKELLENTIQTQEAERDRIAKDLHDDVASKLNIAHLNVHLLKQKMEIPTDAANLLSQIETMLQQSSEQVRSISHELMPPLFKKFGLSQVIADLKDNLDTSEQLDFQYFNLDLLAIKEPIKTLHIFRMAQELLNNTLKYAEAQSGTLTFSLLQNQQIQMTYMDDGKGFELENIKRGQGLSNVETRIRLLNGTLKIKNDASKGAHFVFIFPNYD